MSAVAADPYLRLATQARRRPLTDSENDLARALEEIFTSGQHDFAAVAGILNDRCIVRPSGETGPWTADELQREMELINASLDVAYSSASALGSYR